MTIKSKNGAPKMKASGYSEAGASTKRKAMKSFNPASSSAQNDIDFNNGTLRQRSRVLVMSTPIATSAVNTRRTNIVGQGLRLQSTIDRDVLGMTDDEALEWQKALEREFNLWASDKRSCDAIGMNDFYGMQQLVLTSWLASGDVFALIKHEKTSRQKPYGLRLHIIEADRVSTPWEMTGLPGGNMTTAQTPGGNYIYDGVEVDSSGLPIAYYVCNQYPNEFGRSEAKKWTRVPAVQARTGLPNILHIMSSERPDQYRGVPFLSPVMELALQLRRYTEHEINAAQIESSMSGFITTGADPTDIPFNQTADEPEEGGGDGEDLYLEPGTFIHLKDGESVQNISPARPAGGFPQFVDAVEELIGAGVETPKELLAKKFTASYSASRAALLEAWKSFSMQRVWLQNAFCNPVLEWFVSEAISRGRLSAPGFFSDPAIKAAYLKCNWIGPSQGQLDPVKEITAEIMAISEGFTTHKAATTKLNGSDWDANIAGLKTENEKIQGCPDPHQKQTAGPEQPGNNMKGDPVRSKAWLDHIEKILSSTDEEIERR